MKCHAELQLAIESAVKAEAIEFIDNLPEWT